LFPFLRIAMPKPKYEPEVNDIIVVGCEPNDRHELVCTRKLECGSYGVCWLAQLSERSPRLGFPEVVCLKIFFDPSNPMVAKEMSTLRELMRKKVKHAQIATPYAAFDNGIAKTPSGVPLAQDVLGAVFQFCPGGELWSYVSLAQPNPVTQKKFTIEPFPLPIARYYFRQLLRVVTYLHAKDVYHRDIKAENLVLDGAARCPPRRSHDAGLFPTPTSSRRICVRRARQPEAHRLDVCKGGLRPLALIGMLRVPAPQSGGIHFESERPTLRGSQPWVARTHTHTHAPAPTDGRTGK
jgi:serine/threonine protein kinase